MFESFVSLEDVKGNHAPAWSRNLRRIAARTDGSSNQVTLALRGNEVRVLLDMVVEASLDGRAIKPDPQEMMCKEHVDEEVLNHAEDGHKACSILDAIVTKLWSALDNAEKSKPTIDVAEWKRRVGANSHRLPRAASK